VDHVLHSCHVSLAAVDLYKTNRFSILTSLNPQDLY
jgi:hypothetical protein